MSEKQNIHITGLNNSVLFDLVHITGLNGEFVYRQLEDITVKHIYISQEILLNDTNGSQCLTEQLNDQLSFRDTQSNNLFEYLLNTIDDLFNISDDFENYLYSMTKLQQKFVFNQNFNEIEDISNVVVQNSYLNFVQNEFVVQNNEIYLYSDGFSYCQSWCESDYVKKDNIINFVINTDIVVNDIIYSSVNIQYYKFTIFDCFNFFIEPYMTENKTTLKQKFYSNKNLNNEYVNDFYKIQYDNDIHQTTLIDTKQYFIYSNKDGAIFNNNITLSCGNHNMKIRKLNTPKSYSFKINVINPYYKIGDKIYQIEHQQLENAKVLSNYQLQPIQRTEILNDTISFV